MNHTLASERSPRVGSLLIARAATLIVIASVLCSGRCLPLAGAAETSAKRLIASQRVLVIAHRGNSSVAPENTIPAFASAVTAGADLIELDYHHSAGGVPVVIHDATVSRTSDAPPMVGNGDGRPVNSMSVEALRQLDVGSWFGKEFAGTRIPTMAEALAVIQNGSTTLIERKAGNAATCVELLKKADLLDSVVVQSFDWEYVADCHRLAPDLVVGALGGRELTDQKLDQMVGTGASIVIWHERSADEEAIRAIHDRGLRAWVFTVNNLNRVRELVRAGIDGIITDVPADVRRVVAEIEESSSAAQETVTPRATDCTMTTREGARISHGDCGEYRGLRAFVRHGHTQLAV